MTQKEIIELIKLINKTDLSEVKIKDGEFQISIRTKDFFTAKSTNSDLVNPAISFPAVAAAPAPVHQVHTPQQQEQPTIKDSVPPVKKEESEADSSNLIAIKSPIVGTFYRSSAPDKPAFVKVGDSISNGSVVCIVEAMKLFNEIESEISGKIVKVMVEDASPVEYDQVLFLVDPS